MAGALVLALLATVARGVSAQDPAPNLALAERFVDAFYSFDLRPLDALLREAGDAHSDILFYQGWAKGGHYTTVERMPCEATDPITVSCSITVQDDLVLALGIDFDVTDTFTLTIADGVIRGVDTSSNDPQLYHDARDWVWANQTPAVQGPCRGSDSETPDPERCVTAMLAGYRAYARLEGLTPRATAPGR